MITYTKTRRIERSAEAAFDVIGTHVFDNHPKWEPEVLEIRRLDDGPVGVGSRAVMVRSERGRVSETEYSVTEFSPPTRIAFDHPGSSLGFALETSILPVTATSCDITTRVTMQPRGWVRLLTPLLRLGTPRRGDRLTASQAKVIERTASAARSGTGRPPAADPSAPADLVTRAQSDADKGGSDV
ncbi:SRPBCC family protein [Agromyces laixinhei]|uniref:SRPBCC family protein n=1 Tax=Agromyces laixinhei TaxID=2585717 RepID=UPI0011173135|nr:SRPBCC family protein [Agromyces laixinhei]